MYDKFNAFSEAQAVTADAASTNLIDLKAARQMGAGRPLYVVVHCVTAMTDASSDSTCTVTVETDTAASFGSATTAQTIGTFAALAAAGTVIIAPLMVFGTAEAFVRLKYTMANGNLSTGSFTAYLTLDPNIATLYAKNYTITD